MHHLCTGYRFGGSTLKVPWADMHKLFYFRLKLEKLKDNTIWDATDCTVGLLIPNINTKYKTHSEEPVSFQRGEAINLDPECPTVKTV